MKNLLICLLLGAIASRAEAAWRQATENELKALIPPRAPVEKERIETEFRTASGVTDGKGKFLAGVVLITAGYAAEGKYSNFLIVQRAIKAGGVVLAPGEYVFGWRRKDDDAIEIHFYEAHTGQSLGSAEARRLSRTGRIESFHISPPGDHAAIQVGRFGVSYTLD